MQATTIKISGKEKITSIRLREKTKKMLDALSQGKETHEEILLRLIKLANQLNKETGTQIMQRGNVTGTKYSRSHKTFTVDYKGEKYSVVCTYNDLTLVHMLRQSGSLRNYYAHKGEVPQWEVDLEIVNMRKGKGQWHPTQSQGHGEGSRKSLLLYLACLKQILEEAFDITLYEINTEEEFFDQNNWRKAYRRNDLSEDSLDRDVMRKLKGR